MTPTQLARYEALWQRLRKQGGLPGDRIEALLLLLERQASVPAREQQARRQAAGRRAADQRPAGDLASRRYPAGRYPAWDALRHPLHRRTPIAPLRAATPRPRSTSCIAPPAAAPPPRPGGANWNCRPPRRSATFATPSSAGRAAATGPPFPRASGSWCWNGAAFAARPRAAPAPNTWRCTTSSRAPGAAPTTPRTCAVLCSACHAQAHRHPRSEAHLGEGID